MKKILALVLVLLLTLSLLTACGGGGKKSDKVVIGAAFTGVDLGFWGAVWSGVEDAVNDKGVEVIQLVAEGDANKQNDQIRSLIAQKVDAIIIAPVDGSVVVSAVKEAQAAGIPVVMVNRPLQSDEVVAEMSVLSDNYTMAYDQLVWLAEKARTEGRTYNILLLIGGLSDENAVLRREGHYKAIDENSDVLKLIVDVPTDWKSELALQGVQNSMQAYDNIDCIVTPADGFVVPIQSALEQINRWVLVGQPGHVTICSFDGDSRAMALYDSGHITCTAVQDAYGQGVKSVNYAIDLVNGKTFSDKIDLDPGIQLSYENFEELKPTLWGWAVYLDVKDQ